MRQILSSTGTYNYPLVKRHEEKLKPPSTNAHTINYIFQFSKVNTSIDADHILVSYDVTALFTSVPAHNLPAHATTTIQCGESFLRQLVQ